MHRRCIKVLRRCLGGLHINNGDMDFIIGSNAIINCFIDFTVDHKERRMTWVALVKQHL